MASLSSENGRRIIYLNRPRRPKVSLGRISKSQAESICRHVENLEAAKLDGSAPHDRTSRWLREIDSKLRRRLADLGLCEPLESDRGLTLGQAIERYKLQKYPGYKPGTIQIHDQAFNQAKKFWGARRPMQTITGGDAEALRDHMLQDGLAEATTRKRCAIVAKLFRHAIKFRIIDRNPFADGEVPMANVASPHAGYVSEADALAVLGKISGSEWRLLFGLARWAGLRIGSEARPLRWGDIDFDAERIRVTSPKTANYPGRETRLIPLFTGTLERLVLDRLAVAQDSDEAAPGDLVLPMLRGRSDASLRKRITTAADAAGVPQWRRLWHTLRASCQTDLVTRGVAPHVVCAFLGNSPKIAEKHYLRVHDAHFDQHTARGQKMGAEMGAVRGRQALQSEDTAEKT
ncbi:Tyrosine recombinase XerC [Posidoniimonas corsicana]|uniref:Tyrosine recombinase XerC n=1 Tax=Posidoniimonas corsicana TaxID=1938618 RepID=A0A5C5VGF2_9BACT|nr:site-specific integrase [Posidoniimonas corsicana]TWT37646.1 Tyrosine recombinase XerC [Posidoniimonas corsicana]